MSLFKLTGQKLLSIKDNPFKLEREIQKITEDNLSQVFGLEFIKSELALHDLRFDTLAFDNESKSFVIIEYKNEKSFSVIDQGYAYLSLMLNNKADFILEYNESKNQQLKREDVDWSQSRVIFVSPLFSKYQRQAINFRDLPMELWEVTRYENDLIQYNQLKSSETSESIKKISKSNQIVDSVTREVKVYTEEDHLSYCNDDIVALYNEFKDQILSLGNNIEVAPKKTYIAFKAPSNFIDILPQKNKLKFWLNVPKGELRDSNSLGRDVSEVGKHGNGDYEFNISSSSEFINVLPLVQQSYERNK